MLTMEQLQTEIRRYKKQRTLWELDTTSWNSSLKVDELTDKINYLENQLYELEFQQLEDEENKNNLQG
ncbi:MAG: hypothetical protein RR844_05665 [Clostridium sp.]